MNSAAWYSCASMPRYVSQMGFCLCLNACPVQCDVLQPFPCCPPPATMCTSHQKGPTTATSLMSSVRQLDIQVMWAQLYQPILPWATQEYMKDPALPMLPCSCPPVHLSDLSLCVHAHISSSVCHVSAFNCAESATQLITIDRIGSSVATQ